MTIEMQRRALYIPVLHIDANLINARQKLSAVNQLEKWADEERAAIGFDRFEREHNCKFKLR